jgi:hypothetical protein
MPSALAPSAPSHRHEPGRHDPPSQPRPAPAARFGKQEERPQTLSVVVYRPAVPGSPLVLCRNDIVDVGHPDGAQGNTLSSQPEEEVVGGAAVVLYGRRGKAALLAQPLLKDRDLCVMRMVLMFEFVEPPQEAQPLDSATDKARAPLPAPPEAAPASLGCAIKKTFPPAWRKSAPGSRRAHR